MTADLLPCQHRYVRQYPATGADGLWTCVACGIRVPPTVPLAALVPDSLDAAWADLIRVPGWGHYSFGWHHGLSHEADAWYANAHRLDSESTEEQAAGPTPAAALRALAAALREGREP